MRALVLGLLAVASSLGQKVDVEFDESIDFSQFRTFAIRDGGIHSKHPSLNNDVVKKRIVNEIEKRLTEKGLTKASGQPDLNIRYSLGAANRKEVDTYPAGWRGRGIRRVQIRYTEGTLVIDLRDRAARTLVWRAVAVENKNDPAKIADRLDEMVKKSFDDFPPRRK